MAKSPKNTPTFFTTISLPPSIEQPEAIARKNVKEQFCTYIRRNRDGAAELLQGEGGGAVGGDGGGGVLKLLCCDVGDALGGFFARTYAAVVEQALGG